MDQIINIVPPLLYFILGIVCSIMAFKTISAKKYLRFHEEAAGKPWDNLDEPLKPVILSFLRLSGLGFLVMAILLIVCPFVNLLTPNSFYEYAIPVIGLIFCTGLFLINYSLHRKTKVDTPWKGSLYAMILLIAGIIISVFR